MFKLNKYVPVVSMLETEIFVLLLNHTAYTDKNIIKNLILLMMELTLRIMGMAQG